MSGVSMPACNAIRRRILVVAAVIAVVPLVLEVPVSNALASPERVGPSCHFDGTELSCTFSYDGGATGANGSAQKFVVPPGVTQVTIEAWGAEGGDVSESPDTGGPGGYAKGTVAVAPGDVLHVRVGGKPTGTTGGYNGGGGSGAPQTDYGTGAGGGATDIRLGGDALADRIIVAGGGGGGAYDSYLTGYGGPFSAYYQYAQGGAGGGSSGSTGIYCAAGGFYPSCGEGGSATAGGAAGPSMLPCVTGGTLGVGGTGCGGGGGGGYFGGGGGGYFDGIPDCCSSLGAITVESAGGGGSGYVTPTATGTALDAGLQFGNGLVRISYLSAHTHPGLTWSAPVSIDSTGGALSGISCSTAKFCIAVDSKGNAATYSHGRWSAFTAVAGPGNDFTSVSCASKTFCAAVGTDSAGDDTDLAVIYDHGTWSSNTSDTIYPGETLASVSCAKNTTFCTAVGSYNPGVGDTMVSETYNGHAWTASGGGSGYGSPGDLLATVSCAAANSCVTGGIVQDRNDVGDWLGITYHRGFSGGQITNNGVMGLSDWLDASACTGASCVVAGNGNYVFTVRRSAWSGPYDPDGTSTITALSCSSASDCLAVDDTGAVLADSSGTWSAPVMIDPGHALSAVSCPTAGFCAAVDPAGRAVTAS